MSRSVRKISQSADEILFTSPTGPGWFVAAGGGGLVLWGLLGLEGAWTTAAVLFGLLLILSGLQNALYRMELVMDLPRREYRYRRGYVGSREEGVGSFDDIEAVVLKKELERRGSDEVDDWEIELVLEGWPRPIEVAETEDAAEARREAEQLATRLGVPLRERIGY